MCSMRLFTNRIPLVWPEKFTIVFWFDSRISLSQHVARGHRHTVHNPVIKWNITLKYCILLANSISVFCILLFGSSANADRFVTGSSVWMQSFIFELLILRIILLIIAECFVPKWSIYFFIGMRVHCVIQLFSITDCKSAPHAHKLHVTKLNKRQNINYHHRSYSQHKTYSRAVSMLENNLCVIYTSVNVSGSISVCFECVRVFVSGLSSQVSVSFPAKIQVPTQSIRLHWNVSEMLSTAKYVDRVEISLCLWVRERETKEKFKCVKINDRTIAAQWLVCKSEKCAFWVKTISKASIDARNRLEWWKKRTYCRTLSYMTLSVRWIHST